MEKFYGGKGQRYLAVMDGRWGEIGWCKDVYV